MAEHTGITQARVDRGGNLRVHAGWRQRAFYPAGEWVSVTFTKSGTCNVITSNWQHGTVEEATRPIRDER